MTTATITSKSQVTIPAEVRKDLHVGPGDRIEFVKVADGHYEIIAATRNVSEIKGMIKTNRTISIDEMNQAIHSRAAQS